MPARAQAESSDPVRRAAVAVGAGLLSVVALRYLCFAALHLLSLAAGREGLAANANGGDDGDYYWHAAQDVAAGWNASVVNIYPAVLGVLMRLTGVREIFAYKTLNFTLGVLLIAVALRLRTRLDGPEVDGDGLPTAGQRILLIGLVGLYPSTIIFALGSLYRDGWIYLLHPLAVLLLVATLQAETPAERGSYGVACAATLGALGLFRWYGPVSVVLGLAGWATFRALRRRLGPTVATLAMAGAGAALLGVLVVASTAAAASLTQGLLSSERLLELLEYRSGYEGTGAQSNIGVDFTKTSLASAPALFVYSFLSNALGPLPNQVRSGATLVGFVSEVPVLAFVTARLWRLRQFRDDGVSLVVWQALAWFGLIAFFNDNLGTAFRLRVLGWNCLFVAYVVLRSRAARAAPAALQLTA